MRRAATNRIANVLRRGQEAVSPNMYGTIPDVGAFGTPGSLPTNPGEIDPPILTGQFPIPNTTALPPSPGNYWTRIDPGYGQPNPSLTINPGDNPSDNRGGNMNSTPIPPMGVQIGPNGVLSGGNAGPQGSVYGTDPNTGNPIYNVTGSPRPGFFDSKTGKFVENIAAGGLNSFIPGLGFVSKAIFDAARNRANARNTGTDLTHRLSPPAGGRAGEAGVPLPNLSDPYTGYAPGASGPGYGMNASQAADLMEMWDQSRLQPTNRAVAPDSGRDRFSPTSGFTGQIDPETGMLNRIASPFLASLAAHTSQGGPPLYANPTSADAYNQWVMSHR
jgi:hypothetical protein